MGTETNTEDSWTSEFRILSTVDLDFVIGQSHGTPVGMFRTAPPEFRRRMLAAMVSWQFGLDSIDYTKRKYIPKNKYEDEKYSLGDEISDYLSKSIDTLREELTKLHTVKNLTYGIFGSEVTIYMLPNILDNARMLSNRGLYLEVLPILRLGLEMISWAAMAFHCKSEDDVDGLKPNKCITMTKNIYGTIGNIYGYLSSFSHWHRSIHHNFISIDENKVMVSRASSKNRALSLVSCLLLLDVLIEIIGYIYKEKSTKLIEIIQKSNDSDEKNTILLVRKVIILSNSDDVKMIGAMMCPSTPL